jgi:hypothetical protein
MRCRLLCQSFPDQPRHKPHRPNIMRSFGAVLFPPVWFFAIPDPPPLVGSAFCSPPSGAAAPHAAQPRKEGQSGFPHLASSSRWWPHPDAARRQLRCIPAYTRRDHRRDATGDVPRDALCCAHGRPCDRAAPAARGRRDILRLRAGRTSRPACTCTSMPKTRPPVIPPPAPHAVTVGFVDKQTLHLV